MHYLNTFRSNAFRLRQLLLLIATFGIFASATAAPEAPKISLFDFEGGERGTEIPLLIEGDNTGDRNYQLYMKSVDNDGPFELTEAEYYAAQFQMDPNDEPQTIHVFFPFIEFSGVYEIYITEVNSAGEESSPSNILELELKPYEEYPTLGWEIETENGSTAKKNELYEFKVRAYDYIENIEVEVIFLDSPDGATLNNGTVSFTPTEGGNYQFVFGPKDSEKYPYSSYIHNIYVTQCDIPASIIFTFEDEDAKPFEYGYLELFQMDGEAKDPMDSRGGYYNSYDVRDGKVEINNLDKGKYVYWYYMDGAINPEMGEFYYDENGEWIGDDAWEDQTIEVECGQSYTKNIILERAYSSETFTLKGRVEAENTGEAYPYAMVSAVGSKKDAKKGNKYRFYFTAGTDGNGNFEVNLPVDLEYVVMAEAFDFVEGGRESYMREYWKEASTLVDATTINSNFAGEMVFTLEAPEPFENSISGTVSVAEGDETPQTDVFAFIVEPDEEYADERFPGYFEGWPVTTDDNGNYTIEDLLPGKYVLMAMPQSDKYMPGFYGQEDTKMHWDESAMIEVGPESNLTGIDIVLAKAGKREGSGIIKGFVNAEGDPKGGLIKQEAGGMGGVTIFATNTATGEIFSDMTIDNGYYEIKGLPMGTYRISADKVGYIPDNREITIGEGEEGEVEADMVIKATVSSVEENRFELTLYPNPTADNFSVSFAENLNSVNITLTTVEGRTVQARSLQAVSSGTSMDFNISDLSAGTYMLSIESNGKTSTYPVIRK